MVREDLGPRVWRAYHYPCIEGLRKQLHRAGTSSWGGGGGGSRAPTIQKSEFELSSTTPASRGYASSSIEQVPLAGGGGGGGGSRAPTIQKSEFELSSTTPASRGYASSSGGGHEHLQSRRVSLN